MKPICGVVLNEKQIQLKLGTILNVDHSFNIGARVLVHYDLTKNRPRLIELAKLVYPGMELSEPVEEANDGVSCERLVAHDYLDGVVQ